MCFRSFDKCNAIKRSRPLEAHERAVHGPGAQARGVLRVRDEDEGEPGGRGRGRVRVRRGGRGRVRRRRVRRAWRDGFAVIAGRLDRQAHEQRLLDAERDGLVGGEECDDGAVLAGALSAVGREAAQVGARDAERGGGVRLGARRELRAPAADEPVAARSEAPGAAAGGGARGRGRGRGRSGRSWSPRMPAGR